VIEAAPARPDAAKTAATLGDVGDFYARLKYPGPDALITFVWADRLKPYLPAGEFRFLDAGCGSGRHSAGLLLRYLNATGVGVDISEPILNEARALMAAKGLTGRIELRKANYASSLALPGAFDLALAVGTIHHTPDPAASLGNIAAAVKPGGLVAAMVYGARGHRRRYEIKEMLELLGGHDAELKRRLYDSYRRRYESWLDRTPRQSLRRMRATVSRWRHGLLGRAGDSGYNPDPTRNMVFFLDSFASPIDRAFEWPELAGMIEGAGLTLEHMFTLGRDDPSLLPADWRPYWRVLEPRQRIRVSELIDPVPASFSFIARKSGGGA
jgi:SAM-dependent methyltransferase